MKTVLTMITVAVLCAGFSTGELYGDQIDPDASVNPVPRFYALDPGSEGEPVEEGSIHSDKVTADGDTAPKGQGTESGGDSSGGAEGSEGEGGGAGEVESPAGGAVFTLEDRKSVV